MVTDLELTMSTSILLIHPESAVRVAARSLLEAAGYRVRESEELRLTELGSPEVLLVSWSNLSPLGESLRWLRSQDGTRQSRVIVMAERRDLSAAINALEYGADDCVMVPFEGEELLVRVNASLRRSPSALHDDKLKAGPIILDRSVHRVLVNDEPVELAPTEFRLMAFLLEHQGRVFSRKELLSRAWSSNVKAGHRTVDVHVRRLRQQLEPFGCETMIQTVRGFGYRLRADE